MKAYKFFYLILLIIFTQFITSCSSKNSMNPEDFKDKKPRLIIEEFLAGEVKAWGVLQNRFVVKLQGNFQRYLMENGMVIILNLR